MSGKKPSNVGFAIVRGFRGEMLYLASVHTGNGFRWVAGKQNALVIETADEAVALSERASREYGAKTTVVDFHSSEHIIEAATAAKVPCTCGAPIDNTRCEAHDVGAATFHGHNAEGLAIYRNVVLS